MNKLILFFTVLFASQMMQAQKLEPKDTEDWRHKPEVVTPGKKCNMPPSDAIILYSGKKDASKWEMDRDGSPLTWKASKVLTTVKGTGYVRTKQKFGDVQLHIEWRTPKKVAGDGQGRGNSGVFLMGQYEVQVLDSYNNTTYYNGQAGSVYKQYAPLVNASRGPGKWQTYDIFFTAPRFNDDKTLKSPAYITVIHNGVLIQDHVELEGPTVYGGLPQYKYHEAKLPLKLQDHGNPVQFRNIWIRELDKWDTKTPLDKLSTMDPFERNGWKLAVQAWSFKEFTFTEAVKFARDMGLKYIESFPGQKIGGGIEGTTLYTMDKATREKLKKMLADNNVKMISYGVVNCKTEDEWKQMFEFAKDMGLDVINTEPPYEQVPLIDSLAQIYKQKVGIHNHATGSKYYQPETVLKVLKGRSKYIGACPDDGHWIRSGIDPLKAYKELEGHIISLHFKDMNEFGNIKAHTVPIGTGVLDVKAALQELKDLGFKGVMTLEYEYHWDDPLPDIKQSVNYLKTVAAEVK